MIWLAVLNIVFVLFFGFSEFPAVVSSNTVMINLKPGSPLAPWEKDSTKRAAVLAADDRYFLFLNRSDEIQPIASITKLMTALVFLENNPGWDTVYKISPEDNIVGGKVNLFLGEIINLKDLFYTSLIASDNGATIALVHATGLSEEEFVVKMNIKAGKLGLENTKFSDPIGLSPENISTAREVALLAKEAFEKKEIREATAKKDYSFETINGREKYIESTDDLLFKNTSDSLEILGGKTGFIEEAGYCYVGYMRSPNGNTVISVVLGSEDRSE